MVFLPHLLRLNTSLAFGPILKVSEDEKNNGWDLQLCNLASDLARVLLILDNHSTLIALKFVYHQSYHILIDHNFIRAYRHYRSCLNANTKKYRLIQQRGVSLLTGTPRIPSWVLLHPSFVAFKVLNSATKGQSKQKSAGGSLNSAIYLNWTIEFVTHMDTGSRIQRSLLRLVGTQKKVPQEYFFKSFEDHKRQRQDCLIIIDLVSWPKIEEDAIRGHHHQCFWEWFPFLKWLMDRISFCKTSAAAASSLFFFCKTWFGVKPLSFGTVIKARNWKIDSG